MQRAHQIAHRVRLSVEQLEDRLVPTSPSAEFQVNTTTENTQGLPVVAIAANGRFVIAWESFDQDGDGSGIYAQRFNRHGKPKGIEFRVNTTTEGSQGNPNLGMDSHGNFLITWADATFIRGQRFDAQGNTMSNEITLADEVGGYRFAMNSTGTFVVAWFDSSGSESDVYARCFDLQGNPLGDATLVHDDITGRQTLNAVDIDRLGNYVVNWTSWPGSTATSYVRRFDYAGHDLTDEIFVFSHGALQSIDSTVAVDRNGKFVVIWERIDSNRHLFGQLFHASGQAKGGLFPVNTMPNPKTSPILFPHVGFDKSGKFVVTWTLWSRQNDDYSIMVRKFSAAGRPLSSEIKVNATPDSHWSRISVHPDGHFIVTWQAGEPSDILARRLDSTIFIGMWGNSQLGHDSEYANPYAARL